MDISMQQEQALAIARMLVKAGMPMFLAHPDLGARHGWRLPFGWETNEPDVSVVDSWRPGMALCAVTGHTFDLVDVDPRSGGSEADLGAVMPHSYLTAETPSGGRHHFVKTLGVPSLDGKVSPGIDVKSGTLEGEGRGFAFIAPTVRASKVDGVEREYRWVVGPKGPVLPSPDQLAQDGSGGLLRARVLEIRRTSASSTPRRIGMSQARREWDSAITRLTTDVRGWMRSGWGGEAHSSILAVTMHLARLSPETAEQGFHEAFEKAGAVPDHADLQKLHSAIEKAIPDIVVPDSELSPAESFFSGGAAPVSPGASLSAGSPFDAGALTASPLGSASPLVFAGDGAVVSDRRFRLLDEFEAESIEPPEPIIEGVLYTGTKARLSAPSRSAKTWLVLDMLAHVANGRPWQGRPTRETKVLYVSGEGAPSFAPRVKAWREYHGVPSRIIMTPDIPQVGSEEWFVFMQEMMEFQPGLIVFDTASTITVGLEENSNKDANVILFRLGQLITATKACLLLVHHTGWDDKGRPRGASAMYGGMDTELILQREGKSLELTLHIDKQKYVEEDRPIRLRLEKVCVGDGTGLVVVPPRAALKGTGGFFSGAEHTEHETKVRDLVKRIEAYYAAGGTAKPSARALVQVLRQELNVKAKTDLLREASQRYMSGLGMPVDLSGEE